MMVKQPSLIETESQDIEVEVPIRPADAASGADITSTHEPQRVILETAEAVGKLETAASGSKFRKIYKLELYADGTASCTCSRWQSSQPAGGCKHLRKMRWRIYSIDSLQMVKHVAAIFGPLKYLSNLAEAVIAEDDRCRNKHDKNPTQASVPLLSDLDRAILQEITDLFHVRGGAPNDAPIDGSIGTGIMAWFLKAGLDVRLHPCMESNKAKAYWIQRVRATDGEKPPNPPRCKKHDHHFEDRWPMNRLDGAPDWGPTNHLAEQARGPL